MEGAPEAYEVACHNCQHSFDAMAVPWCSCLVAERTLVCPSCLTCFCKAPALYKRSFWSGAPRALWDRKFAEHHSELVSRPNPAPGEVVRPLVLLVDDEKDILRVATRTVESLGYGMIVGRNGAEGLALAKEYRPDLVMTALYTSVKYQTEAYKSFKVDDYLAKPLDFSQLRALLEKHLG